MFVLARAVSYATVFIGLLLIFVPARILSWSGIVRPEVIAAPQIAGSIIALGGGAVALSCVLAFAVIGKGTPAPFDPPRRLVIRGPYRFVRNPMYVGAGLALVGAAIFFQSWYLLGYAGIFLGATHLFVIAHEEPHLRGIFGQEYAEYCERVRRWLPRW